MITDAELVNVEDAVREFDRVTTELTAEIAANGNTRRADILRAERVDAREEYKAALDVLTQKRGADEIGGTDGNGRATVTVVYDSEQRHQCRMTYDDTGRLVISFGDHFPSESDGGWHYLALWMRTVAGIPNLPAQPVG